MAEIVENQGGDGKKNKVKKASTHVDMTPLADLGFLLITFFMFTTTFSKPNIMTLNMPPKIDDRENKPDKPPEIDLTNSLSLILGKDNKVYWHQQDKNDLTTATLNETDYSREGLRKVITDAKKRARNKDLFTVIIKPTDDSTYENLVNTLDEMEITESGKYGIVELGPNELAVYNQK